MAAIPQPTRKRITPQLGDDWPRIAATVFPHEPAEAAIAALQSWNPHIVYRPPSTLGLLCSDIVFIEAPNDL
jgi:hypothetical protein